MKTEKLQALKHLFEKHTILMMSDIQSSFETTAMRTIIRYLKELGYYSSYNRAGMFYTIAGIPKFDGCGLWSYKEALFSTHGNLKETICAQVDMSDAGMTQVELAALLRVSTKSALTLLAAEGAIARSKSRGAYVYYSKDPKRRGRQAERRAALVESIDSQAEFEPNDIVNVLDAYIKGIRTPAQVTAHLQKKKRGASLSVVAAIFERFDLEHGADEKRNAIESD